MRYLNIIAAAVLALACPFISAAQESTSIFNYSRSDRNPVTAAMAGASFTNTCALAWSALSNPSAALFASKRIELAGSAQSWAPDATATTSANFAAGYNSGRFLISFAATYSTDEPYEIIASDALIKGSFTPNGMYAGLGMAYKIQDKLSVGASLKYFSSALAEKSSYNGIGAGLMLTYHQNGLTAAAGIQDLGPKVKGRGEAEYSLPTSAAFSASYTMSSEQDHAVHAELDAHYFLLGGFSAAVGAQYGYRDLIFARAGYHLASGAAPIASFASLGAGVKLSAFELNIAYIPASKTLAGTMLFGLGYSF